MIIKEALKWAEANLNKSKVESPALDTEVLLSFVLDKNRGWLFAHAEKKIAPAQWKKFQKLIAQRRNHEPVAYLIGHKEFYGLDFLVNKQVLIPRPETELMIDFLRERSSDGLIIDVGTGSGCLAVTVAKLWPRTKIVAIDISKSALKVAEANARRHHVTKQIKFLKSASLPRGKGDKQLIILANLPYLPTAHWRQAPPEVRLFEPKTAVDGGPDGLKYYRSLLKQLSIRLRQPAYTALLEIDPRQSKPLSKIIKKTLPSASIEVKKDLAGLERLLIIRS